MYLVFFVTGPQKVGTTSEIFTGAIRRMVLVWHKARAIYGRVIFFSGRVNGIVERDAKPSTALQRASKMCSCNPSRGQPHAPQAGAQARDGGPRNVRKR